MTKTRGEENRMRSLIGVIMLSVILLVSFSSPTVSLIADGMSSQAGSTAHSSTSLVWDGNRIAVVRPSFSATAYQDAFYLFYSKYRNVPVGEYVTTDLGLLNRTVVTGWKWSEELRTWFTTGDASSLHLVLDETVTVLDEIDVDRGGLFENGTRTYDVLILGFTEYVTQREYLYYKQFVVSGGTLIIMDACSFLAEVSYSNGYLSLTKGHGWEFNGTHAWKSVYHRWPEENTNWVGGNYWKYWYGEHYDYFSVNTSNVVSTYLRTTFGENITTIYGGHEENLLQNLTQSEVIGYWHLSDSSEYPGQPIAAYMHRYGHGIVIHSGIMASEVVTADRFVGVFLAACLRFGLTGNIEEWTYPEPLVPSDDALESVVTMHNQNGSVAAETLSGLAYCDVNFSATTGVLRCCYHCNLDSVVGELTMQVDGENRSSQSLIVRGRAVSDNCWRLDINTLSVPNGNYSLAINATWKGIRSPVTFNDFIDVLCFAVVNEQMPAFYPWVETVIAATSIACVAVSHRWLTRTRARRSVTDTCPI